MRKLALSMLIISMMFVSCAPVRKEGVEYHVGDKKLKITEIKCDTVELDGSSLSLEGTWMMKGDTLVWFDKYTHGAHLFSTDGSYISRRIEKGEGPDDMQTLPWAVAKTEDGAVVLDESNMIHHYDGSWHKKNRAFYFQRGVKFTDKDWEDLYNNPNPEITHMYEYNFNTGHVAVLDDSTLIMPVMTEHIKFNGYSPSMGSVEYWQKAYTFMTINMNTPSPNVLLGHYPDVYREKNIPVFASYDFAVKDGEIYVGFAADSLVYVMDKAGNVKRTMGYSSALGDVEYPVTLSFDQAEEQMYPMLKKYGRYLYVDICGDYLFRSYRKSDGNGYGVQIYDEDGDMVGDVAADSPMRVGGYEDGKFYAFLSPDKEKDVFRMVTFSL